MGDRDEEIGHKRNVRLDTEPSGANQNIYIHGDAVVNQSTSAEKTREGATEYGDVLSERRQNFLFRFYEQALQQADASFRLSMIVAAAGALVVLSGTVFAVIIYSGPGSQYAGILPALTGIAISTCGGVFALHAHRSRNHLARQAEKVEEDLRSDRKVEYAARLIDRVNDPELKEQLWSIALMQNVELGPNSDTVTSRVIPERSERLARRERYGSRDRHVEESDDP